MKRTTALLLNLLKLSHIRFPSLVQYTKLDETTTGTSPNRQNDVPTLSAKMGATWQHSDSRQLNWRLVLISTIWGSTKKPVATRQLAALLEHTAWGGTLYIGYPIMGTPEGPYPFDAVLLSPQLGLVAFDIVEGRTLADYKIRQDESYNRLSSKLLQYPQLVSRRVLQVEITVVTFSPLCNDLYQSSDDYPIANEANLIDILDGVSWNAPNLYERVISAIQAISTIRRGRKRPPAQIPNSRGYKLHSLEDSIANLDNHQSAAVIETVEGVQRIRGLAGSGKTIVLALKVAYLHAQHPDWKIAVTFNTRSLKGQFQRLINTFVIEQTNNEPDWDQIQILNAWGAPGTTEREGVYYKFCVANDVPYLDYTEAKNTYGQVNAFGGACRKALSDCRSPKPIFDAILIDEAQDFSPYFLLLCYASLTEPRRLVYAYDELQSLTDNSLPPPEDIFGQNPDGTPRVTFGGNSVGQPKQDIILDVCYRNSRPVLVTAHGLGFGIHRKPEGLVQLFDQNSLWLDVGYEVVGGELMDGQYVSLGRTLESSPSFLETHSPINDLIQFIRMESEAQQTDWLVNEIVKNLSEDELQPEDIVVINPDPIKTRDAVAKARAALFSRGVNSVLAGVSNSADVFFENGSVTFTGVFRAKGNEAAMVYVINAQDCYSSPIPSFAAQKRNRLFTAITRSKAWVRVVGFGLDMENLIVEHNAIKNANYHLNFAYPTVQQRAVLKAVNRDESKTQRKRGKKSAAKVQELITVLKQDDFSIDDDLLEALQRLIDEKVNR